MVLAGSFDSIVNCRSTLYESIESALEFGHKAQNSKLSAGENLFGGVEDTLICEPELRIQKPWGEKERLKRERKVIGFYVTGHPLQRFEIEYNSFADLRMGETENIQDMENVKACGVITSLRTKIDRSGKTMAFFTIDDFSGSCECLMFSKIFDEYGRDLKEEEPVFILGNLESSGDTVKIHVNKVLPMEIARKELAQSLKIIVDREKYSTETLLKLKTILLKYEGKIPVFIHLNNNGTKGKLFSLGQHMISLSDEFLMDLKNLFAGESILLNGK